MDFILSVVTFIVVFLLTYDAFQWVLNKILKIKYVVSIKKYIKFSINVISLYVIIFISSDVLQIVNPILEGAFRGSTLALVCNITHTLIKDK